MTTIVTRAVKGSPLTNTELDANFNNLNTEKLDTISGGVLQGALGIMTSVGAATYFQTGVRIQLDNAFTYDTAAGMFVHQTPTATATLNDPKDVLYLGRQGTSGQAYGAAARFQLSRYENNGTNSRTRLDLTLAHGAFDFTSALFVFTSAGSFGLGGVPVATALLDLNSTTQGLLPPRMTTTQRDAISSPANGLVLYDSTTHQMNFRHNGAWVTLSQYLALAGGTLSGDLAFGNNDITGMKTAVYNGEYDCGNSSTAITVTLTNGQNQKVTLTGNCTITLASPPGVGHYQLRLIQDSNGTRTVAWAGTGYSGSRWLGSSAAPVVQTGNAKETFVSLFYDGTNYTMSMLNVGA